MSAHALSLSLGRGLAVFALALASLSTSSCSSCTKPAAGGVDAGAADAGRVAVAAAPVGTGTGSGDGAGGGAAGGGGKRLQVPMVYLDGTPLAAIQFGELPPTMKTTWLKLDGLDKPVRRFALVDYFKALGVDLKKLNGVHLYSGRSRVAVLSPADLAKESDADKTVFSFTQSDTGKVQMRWPAKTPTTDRIDKVVAIALYQDKPAPQRQPGKRDLYLDGLPLEEAPYITVDTKGGTRVYVDGRIVTFVRPRNLTDPDAPQSLLAQIVSQGVATQGVKTADLVSFDTQIARLNGEQLAAQQFVCPGGGGGLLQTVPGGQKITAVLLYRATAPPDWSAR